MVYKHVIYIIVNETSKRCATPQCCIANFHKLCLSRSCLSLAAPPLIITHLYCNKVANCDHFTISTLPSNYYLHYTIGHSLTETEKVLLGKYNKGHEPELLESGEEMINMFACFVQFLIVCWNISGVYTLFILLHHLVSLFKTTDFGGFPKGLHFVYCLEYSKNKINTVLMVIIELPLFVLLLSHFFPFDVQ